MRKKEGVEADADADAEEEEAEEAEEDADAEAEKEAEEAEAEAEAGKQEALATCSQPKRPQRKTHHSQKSCSNIHLLVHGQDGSIRFSETKKSQSSSLPPVSPFPSPLPYAAPAVVLIIIVVIIIFIFAAAEKFHSPVVVVEGRQHRAQ